MQPRTTIDPSGGRLSLPTAGGPVLEVVLDTDTFNEIDDQFALSYALLSPDRLRLSAVLAAPFVNHLSSSAEEGMLKSLNEIGLVYARLGRADAVPSFEGSRRWMKDAGGPVDSPAARHLIDLAMSRKPDDTPLYVVGIGAPTNIASAILMRPEIKSRVVVVWLGGHPSSWHTASEFNLMQDPPASRVLLDSGVPLVRVPCINVAQKLRTCAAELRWHLSGKNSVCEFLIDRFEHYGNGESAYRRKHHFDQPIVYGKEIWDVAAVACLIDSRWFASAIMPSPILTTELTWSIDPRRHACLEIIDINRDFVFGDLFTKLARA
jgi:purine nucleosidase